MDGDVPTGSQNASNHELEKRDAATTTKSTQHGNTRHGLDTCTICLELISQRAVATPCNHLTFDFLCLVSWLQQRPNCPLCKAEVREVQYDWRSTDDYKTHHVLRTPTQTLSSETHRVRPVSRVVSLPNPSEDPSLERRRHVYRHRLYSLHVGSNRISRYREFSPAQFAHSSEFQSKARTFLRRELQIFAFLGNRDFLTEYIIAVFKKYEPKASDGKAAELIKEFLGETNASQLLHELHGWLRSPFDTLRSWDTKVCYLDSAEETNKLQQQLVSSSNRRSSSMIRSTT